MSDLDAFEGGGKKDFFENDICLITKKKDGFVFNIKQRQQKNVLSNVVNTLINKYSKGEMFFYYVDTLEDYINKYGKSDYETGLNFINCMVSQYLLLNDQKKTIFSLNLKNIIVLNNEHFIFLGNPYHKNSSSNADGGRAAGIGVGNIGLGIVDYNIKQNTMLTKQMISILFHSLGKKYYYLCPPEILNYISMLEKKDNHSLNHELPFEISRHLFNFSLGVITIVLFFGEKSINTNKTRDLLDLTDAMQPIKFTKIYYLIERCVNPEPDMRVLLYV